MAFLLNTHPNMSYIYPVPSDRYLSGNLFHYSILSILDNKIFSDYPRYNLLPNLNKSNQLFLNFIHNKSAYITASTFTYF